MYTLLLIVHVLVAFMLIGIVLFQADEGAGFSGAFGTFSGGGSSNPMFGGKKGAAGAVARFTSGLVAVFMVTSFTLAIVVSKKIVSTDEFGLGSFSQTPAQQEVPVQQAPVPQQGTK